MLPGRGRTGSAARPARLLGARTAWTTVGDGEFFCPGCGGDRNYQRLTGRRRFTLLGIPVLPRGETGPVVECAACRGHFGTDVLDHPTTTRFSAMLRDAVHTVALAVLAAGGTCSRTSLEAAAATVRAAGFDDCTEDQLEALVEALAADTGRFYDAPLRSGPRHRAPRGPRPPGPPPRPGRPRVDPRPGRPHRARRRPLHPRRTRRPHDRGHRADHLRGRGDPPAGGGPHALLTLSPPPPRATAANRLRPPELPHAASARDSRALGPDFPPAPRRGRLPGSGLCGPIAARAATARRMAPRRGRPPVTPARSGPGAARFRPCRTGGRGGAGAPRTSSDAPSERPARAPVAARDRPA